MADFEPAPSDTGASQNASAKISRRALLIGSASVVGGVVFGAISYRRSEANPLFEGLASGETAITPYVKINSRGVTLVTPRADLGQGAYSIQAYLIAEELDVDPLAVQLEPGPPSPAYANTKILEEVAPFVPYDDGWVAAHARDLLDASSKLLGFQITGGSSTVPDAFEKLRRAGCVARETLKEAAARELGLPREQLRTRDGEVLAPDGRRIPYPQLAERAATIAPITDVELRPESQWRYLGKPIQRVDTVAKSTGSLTYAIDLRFEGMLYAAVRTNPARGGQIESYDASRAEVMRGVSRVVPISNGIGVLADNTWRAFQAVDAIDITWGPSSYPANQNEIWRTLAKAHDGRRDSRMRNEGDVEAALADPDATSIEAQYRVPYLAHAPLEPMNAVVRYDGEHLDIWTGSQVPGFVQGHAARLAQLDREKVAVHVQPMGGSFGRRLELTYVMQAVEMALAVPGTPVKMTWSREEDMSHDYPRPAQLARMRGAVRAGQVTAYDFANASSSVMASWFGRLLVSPPGPDLTIVAGAWDQPLAIPNYRVTAYRAPEMVPTSSWRSVGASGVGFQHGGFLDELCAAADRDPLDELTRLCSDDLARSVLEELRELSGWEGRDLGKGRGRGVAFTLSFGVPAAEVVEVTHTSRGIRIDRVYAVCEIGRVLDPVNVEAQITGGVIWGLGHAMNCELTYEGYTPQQTNYHNYEGLRLYQTPEITVKALENGDQIRGIGEPAVPPAAPALANAIYAATGRRIRELPLNKHIDFA